MADARRVAVLVSGRGSNLKAIVEQADGYAVELVAGNAPLAPALDFARMAGIPTWAWDSRSVERAAFDERLASALGEHRIGTVALAGYMRILSPGFVSAWRGRIVNIHPSLLPRYKGLDPHAQVLAAGDSITGCTVHLVDEHLDSGDILAQAQVPVEPGDDPASLAARVLEAEHRLYPRALADFVSRRSLPA